MKNRKLKIKNLAIFLTTILALSFFSSSIFIVQAEDPTIGKFLTINFVGDGVENSDCNVTATKLSSEQIFEFCANPENGVNEHRMAAGTVLLTPIPAEGWVFIGFGDLLLNQDKTAYYKTEKYGEVTAEFTRIETYTITATAGDGGSISPAGITTVDYDTDITFSIINDLGYDIVDVIVDGAIHLGSISSYTFYNVQSEHTIEALFAIKTYTITATAGDGGSISPAGITTVDYGTDLTIMFNPDAGYHVSAVIVNNKYVDLIATKYTTQYTFEDIDSSQSIHVVFSLDGLATIEAGDNVIAFLSEGASLNFPTVGDGFAYGEQLFALQEGDIVVWIIEVNADLILNGETVEIALKYDPLLLPEGAEPQYWLLYTCVNDTYEALVRRDFNNDGIVSGEDVKIISNIVKHEKFRPDNIYPYDLNGDGVIDEDDIHEVNSYNNMAYYFSEDDWEPLTTEVDEINGIIYGWTPHFSIFRCR